MICGAISRQSFLSGTITADKNLQGSISGLGGLIGKVSVSVRDVPYYETTNSAGGKTVYIGKEVENHGN